MPDILPFLTIHPHQINEVAAAINAPEKLDVQVKASAQDRSAALQACEAAGIKVPPSGAFTLEELDAELSEAFPREHPQSINNRLAFKLKASAAGMLLERSPVDKKTIVIAGLMLRKAGIPLPVDKPYSLREFDSLMAAKDISPVHKIEIKAACFAAGLIQEDAPKPAQPLPQTISAAKMICDGLGVDFPKAGGKLKTGTVDDVMARKNWDLDRRLRTKAVLAGAGVL
jgi:hypothetical protein